MQNYLPTANIGLIETGRKLTWIALAGAFSYTSFKLKIPDYLPANLIIGPATMYEISRSHRLSIPINLAGYCLGGIIELGRKTIQKSIETIIVPRKRSK